MAMMLSRDAGTLRDFRSADVDLNPDLNHHGARIGQMEKSEMQHEAKVLIATSAAVSIIVFIEELLC